jgi:hypothetical protein
LTFVAASRKARAWLIASGVHCVIKVSTGDVFNETAIISGHGTSYYTTK